MSAEHILIVSKIRLRVCDEQLPQWPVNLQKFGVLHQTKQRPQLLPTTTTATIVEIKITATMAVAVTTRLCVCSQIGVPEGQIAIIVSDSIRSESNLGTATGKLGKQKKNVIEKSARRQCSDRNWRR